MFLRETWVSGSYGDSEYELTKCVSGKSLIFRRDGKTYVMLTGDLVRALLAATEPIPASCAEE